MTAPAALPRDVYKRQVLGSAILLTQKHSAACFTHKHWFTLYPCEMQKLFVGLNALGQEFAIFEPVSYTHLIKALTCVGSVAKIDK